MTFMATTHMTSVFDSALYRKLVVNDRIILYIY